MNWNDTAKKADLIARLALLDTPGLGAITLIRLVSAFGSAEEALGKSESEYRQRADIGPEVAARLAAGVDLSAASKSVERMRELGWKVLLDSDGDYPPALRMISSRPTQIYYFGEIRENDSAAIAIVGTRDATEEGRAFAHRLGADLSTQGVTVVSGMARGIDTAAHRGALSAGGRTFAVLGSSLDYNFPPDIRKTLDDIIENGAVISELPPDAPPFPENFPKRNRIIAGLSQGVIVVEAPERSGALLTARDALDQNRELFAVPGFPTRRMSSGCNELLKTGATPLTSASDVFSALPRLKRETKAHQTTRLEALTPFEERIVRHFTDGPKQIDTLARDMETGVTELLPTLLALELKGIVREMSGKRFALSE